MFHTRLQGVDTGSPSQQRTRLLETNSGSAYEQDRDRLVTQVKHSVSQVIASRRKIREKSLGDSKSKMFCKIYRKDRKTQ